MSVESLRSPRERSLFVVVVVSILAWLLSAVTRVVLVNGRMFLPAWGGLFAGGRVLARHNLPFRRERRVRSGRTRWTAAALIATVSVGGCLPGQRATPRVESVVWRNDDVDDSVLLRADISYADDGPIDELFQQVGDVSTRFVFDGKDDHVSEVTMLQGDTSNRFELAWKENRLQSVTARLATFKETRDYTYWHDDARFIAAIASTRTDNDGEVLSVLKNEFGYDGDRLRHVDTTFTVGDAVSQGSVDFTVDDNTRRLQRVGPDKDTDINGDLRPAITWELSHDGEGRLASVSTLDENQRFDLSYGDDGNVDEVRIRNGNRSSRVTFRYAEGEARGLTFGLDSVFGLSCPVFPLYDLRGRSSNQLTTDTFEGAFGALLTPPSSSASNGPRPPNNSEGPGSIDDPTSVEAADELCGRLMQEPCDSQDPSWCSDTFSYLRASCSDDAPVAAFAAYLECLLADDSSCAERGQSCAPLANGLNELVARSCE